MGEVLEGSEEDKDNDGNNDSIARNHFANNLTVLITKRTLANATIKHDSQGK
jgi:hypothetical protein